jgi:hypothetical protein
MGLVVVQYIQSVLYLKYIFCLAPHSATSSSNPITSKHKTYGYSDLKGADLRTANLYGSNLSGANLNRADHRGADYNRYEPHMHL